ncbi:hypothetical protein QVD17_31528 [Tagetes erecta]|uniref:Uncharacterized protein n=1 Tax=Tagetes erecta TaxID=13708 RepID=A0AAD8NPE4_TARER|nr:hypothetical protein QVD17_31528 [Tagetes erecta]
MMHCGVRVTTVEWILQHLFFFHFGLNYSALPKSNLLYNSSNPNSITSFPPTNASKVTIARHKSICK